MRRTLAVVGFVLGIVGAPAARAQGAAPPGRDPAPPPDAESATLDAGASSSQRHVAVTLEAGAYTGFGAGLQLGSRDVGLRAAVGWTPLLLVATGGYSSELNFYSALQVSSDVYVRLLRPRATTDVGVQLGYRYSSALGHGAAVGGYVQFALNRAADVFVTGGLMIFPDGEAHLRQEENLPSGTTFSFPGPNVNVAASLGLALFP